MPLGAAGMFVSHLCIDTRDVLLKHYRKKKMETLPSRSWWEMVKSKNERIVGVCGNGTTKRGGKNVFANMASHLGMKVT